MTNNTNEHVKSNNNEELVKVRKIYKKNVLDEISSKSNFIKANLKAKYMLHKLEKRKRINFFTH